MIDASMAGSDELRAKIAAIKARIANPGPALEEGGKVLLAAGVARIEAGGPGWKPNIAGTPLLHRTGALLASLAIGGAGDIYDLSQNSISVGTDLTVNGYNLGALMQGGTGVFGPRGERITPSSAQALVFMVGGRKVFATSIAGSPQRRFLFIDGPTADSVKDVFAKYIMTGNPT